MGTGFARFFCKNFGRAGPPGIRRATRHRIPQQTASPGGLPRFFCFGIGKAEIHYAAILTQSGKRRYRYMAYLASVA